MNQISQRYLSAEKIVLSNFRSTSILRKLFYVICIGIYLLIVTLTLTFPVTTSTLLGLIILGMTIMGVIHYYTRKWAACHIKSETLICKHLNGTNSIVPIYSVKEVTQTKIIFFYITTISYRLDGKNQGVKMASRHKLSNVKKSIEQVKENLKKANL